jgi:serine protease Do
LKLVAYAIASTDRLILSFLSEFYDTIASIMSDQLRKLLVVLVILGLLGFVFYELFRSGKLPMQFSPGAVVQNNQVRTVVTEESAVIDTVEKSSASVVAIGVTQRIFNPFNPDMLPRNQQNTIGTGFVVNAEKGVIVTNRHVVSDTNLKYSVVTKDGKKLDVQKIYRDPNLDLALVQVNTDGANLKALELGDSSKLKVGQTVIAIGNALGRFDNTVTTGVVSGLGRTIGAGDPFSGETELLDDLIQTDAAINPGNSGGPLLNSAAQVIGVNVATTEGAQNIGFTVPINAVKKIVEEFVVNGKISRAYLGVQYRLITEDLAKLNDVPQGAYVQEVLNDSPASAADIQPGDIITKIDNQAMNSDTKLSDIIQQKKPDDTITLEVWTDGQTRTISAKLQESPNQ